MLLNQFIAQNKNITMNPENTGEQIALRHSSLWRKQLLYEKSVPKASTCHTQMNELGETGISWRVRNNSISTHSHFNPGRSIPRKTHSKNLSDVLSEGRTSSNQTSLMIRSLKDEADAIDQSQQLVHGMQELKRMNLLLRKNLQKIKFPGVTKFAHIHNDYHERMTNPGYSRNFLGKFYMK